MRHTLEKGCSIFTKQQNFTLVRIETVCKRQNRYEVKNKFCFGGWCKALWEKKNAWY